ncbi:MAG TPA: beta-galactosidase [Tepidiformaceae bacterium]|nr:beta-galactosidase [Tepidiformaceae bacterium]
MTRPAALVDDSPLPARRGLGVPRRRLITGFAILGGGAAACLAGLAGLWVLLVALSWPHQEPAGNPQWGINYDCDYVEYLFLEVPGGPFASDGRPGRARYCADNLGTVLSGLGAKYVRISVHWDEVEPREGVYDFSLLDALLAEADRHGAKVLLTVGMKGQRHPEFYIPNWALQRSHTPEGGIPADDPYLHDRALEMVAAVVSHTAASPAIDSWSAENEPFIASPRASNWRLTPEWVAEVRDTIRANDPLGRLVLAAHAQHFVFDRRWQDALDAGDILGASIYPFRDHRVLGIDFVVPILEIGPIAPNYAYQAREARDQGKQFWITEMQGEPWIHTDPRTVGPDNASPNLTESKFRKSVEYARKTGASRVYLWGAEWWLYQKDHYHDDWWWDLAREVIATSPATSLQTANQSR